MMIRMQVLNGLDRGLGEEEEENKRVELRLNTGIFFFSFFLFSFISFPEEVAGLVWFFHFFLFFQRIRLNWR